MSKALKETISKELKDRTVSHQIQNINRDRNYWKKEPNRNSEVEKYYNGNKNTLEEFSSEAELANERIHELKDQTIEIIQSEKGIDNLVWFKR